MRWHNSGQSCMSPSMAFPHGYVRPFQRGVYGLASNRNRWAVTVQCASWRAGTWRALGPSRTAGVLASPLHRRPGVAPDLLHRTLTARHRVFDQVVDMVESDLVD